MNSKNLFKGTVVYSLSNIVTKMGTLIFLPIITRLLTKEEFGIVGTLSPIATLFSVILGLGIYNAQMKKYIDLKDNDRELGSYLFSSILIIFLFHSIIFIFLFTPMSKRLFSYIIDLNVVKYNSLIMLTIAIAAVNSINTLATTLFRMKKMYVKVAIGSLITVFTTYILTIIFIKYIKFGVFGNQLANFIAVVLLLIFYFKDYFGKMYVKFKIEYAKYSIRNGLPLIFIELTDQIINFSDRLIIAKFSSFAMAGSYTLAYTGGQVLSVITSSFINSWTPEFYEVMSVDKKNKKITESLENFISLISIICILGQLFAPEIIKLIFPISYMDTIKYIPIILAGVVIRSLICLDYFFHFHEDSIYIFYFSIFALVINLSANLMLIPRFSEYGILIASWTTLISFLIRIVIELIIIKKKYEVIFNYKKLLLYLFLIINPLIIYFSTPEVSLNKFFMKIIYFVVIIKILLNKGIYEKIITKLKFIKKKI